MTGALAALLCTALAATPALAANTDSWNAEGYGPGNTSFNPSEKRINKKSLRNLTEKFSVNAAAGQSCQDLRPPVVSEWRMFTTPGDGVAAYNSTTGKALWKYTWADARFEDTTVTVAGDRVVVSRLDCSSQSDPYGAIVVLNKANGAVVWQAGPFTTPDLGPAHHTVVDKGVVVVSGSDSDGPTISGRRLSDGALLWHSNTRELTAPVSADGRLLLTVYDDDLTMVGTELVDIATGAALKTWNTFLNPQAANPAGTAIYATQGADLLALHASTGAEVWRQPGYAGTVSADGARIYVASGKALRAFNAATGAGIWSEASPYNFGKPVIAGAVVYANTNGHGIKAWEAPYGSRVTVGRPYEGAIGHPVVVNGKLYVTDGSVLRVYSR